jgi:flagellin-like protein
MKTPRPLPFLKNGHNSKSKQSRRKYPVYKHTFSMEKQKENFGRRCKEKMMINKMRRNTRALSPIFAVLILIAIAVIAGIVVYMFTSGTIASMTGGGTAGQEKVAIQAVEASAGGATLTVYAQSTGGGSVVLDSAILKDSDGLVVGTYTVTGTLTDSLAPIAVTATAGDLVQGDLYTVTLVSAAGGSFVSPSFKAGA